MSASIPVLMFHALYRDKANLYGADPHYSKSVIDFTDLVDYLHLNNISIDSLSNVIHKNKNDNRSICFTFDDGHISNYEEALDILLKHLSSADFFINAAYVGNKGYIDWSGLRDMYASGMSIQSHGHHHYYFDDLDTDNIRKELELSKFMIEDKIGSEVTIFAPPGGRITSEVKEIALDIGYSAIAVSRPGYWKNQSNIIDIPRLAILDNTSLEQMYSWAHLDRSSLTRIVMKYYLTMAVKKTLGNKFYDKFRSAVLGE